ncbi:BTAD domain-containing putative transcriptional regulator [Kribbella sp. NPDC056861]|uniref:AfsR/SARP family transcriptional regulator n=1 Tax=Kribbella sp. NPDC056861 TaxID=3154857 RepID=UPI00342AB4D3
MDFRLLGALEVDGLVGALRRQERALLAILLLRANESVAVSELVDLLWPDGPPADARGSVQVYLSRLRKALPGLTIVGGAAGYVLQVDPELVDVGRFRRLVVAARELQDPVLRGEGLRVALAAWRGEPLADLMPESTRERLRAGLLEEHAAAVEDRVEADLQAGLHERVVDELAELVRTHPQRERLTVGWMTALYRAGRKAEALQAYADLAERLAEEFGLDPAPALRRLHLAILRDDPALQLTAAQRAEGSVPRELPVDISLLVGRDELLADAVRELTREGRERAAVYCLWGGAGVGKSAAGTRIGHLVAGTFPDGQLFARLQDVGGEALPARTLLGRMLRSLGLKPTQVPSTVAEREQAFRDLTADRAVLVVLDDALDPVTVRSLLPAGPRCAAIVTSRKPLPDLTEAVHQQVTPLDSETSRALLNRLIGRTLREQPTLDTVADACVGLPLALRIVGSRLALSGDGGLQSIAGALADDEQRLDSMVAGDLAVRTSLGRTLSLVDPQARQLLERLSLVGVTEFSSWVAAPLLDCDEATGDATFERLVDLGLVELVTAQQYKMHALVRSYAAEQLAAGGDADGPRLRYVHAVHRLTALAEKHLNHGLTLVEHLLVPDQPVLPDIEAAVVAAPIEWFDGSWPLVGAAARAALASGQVELAAVVGLHLNPYFVARDLREPRIELLQPICDELRQTGPLELYARTQRALHAANDLTGEALASEGEEMLELATRAGAVDLQVSALITIGLGARLVGDVDRDLASCTKALSLLDQAGGMTGLRATVLRNLAVIYSETEEHTTAERYAIEAISLAAPGSMAEAMNGVILGEIQLELGKLDEARQVLSRSAEIFEAGSADAYLAMTRCLLARIAAQRGERKVARWLLDQAAERYREHPAHGLGLHVKLAEIVLALEIGDREAAGKIRHELTEEATAQGEVQVLKFLARVFGEAPPPR